MVRGTALVLLFTLLIFGPWYFLKSPFDAAYCLMSGNEWARQGKNGRYCKEVFGDRGQLCAKTSDCKSRKCVIGYWGKLEGFDVSTQKVVLQEEISLGVFRDILNADIRGRCSDNNKSLCYSGEITIDENRIVREPPACSQL